MYWLWQNQSDVRAETAKRHRIPMPICRKAVQRPELIDEICNFVLFFIFVSVKSGSMQHFQWIQRIFRCEFLCRNFGRELLGKSSLSLINH
jgi:hypothetical protein